MNWTQNVSKNMDLITKWSKLKPLNSLVFYLHFDNGGCSEPSLLVEEEV